MRSRVRRGLALDGRVHVRGKTDGGVIATLKQGRRGCAADTAILHHTGAESAAVRAKAAWFGSVWMETLRAGEG